jgi:hypothetical protein
VPDGQADCWLAVYAFLEILREICSFRNLDPLDAAKMTGASWTSARL